MAKSYGKAELEKDFQSLIEKVEYNHETRPALELIFQNCIKVFRSHNLETLIRTKRTGAPIPAANVPAREYVDVVQPAEEKKTETMTENAAPLPVDEVRADLTNEMEILDLYSAGIEDAKSKFDKPASFKKHLKGLGIESQGKTYADLWSALENKFNEIKEG